VRVTGVVQGVGYRPFVFALATSLGLDGHVGNDSAGVVVEVEGDEPAVDELIARLVSDAPPLAVVESVEARDVAVLGATGFVIVESAVVDSAEAALIPPDTTTCPDCLREVLDPADRRHRYPFTACTYCGPRYTLVTGIPYDRPSTTMAGFPLCAACAREYDDPADRRFHAQPTACPECGPRLAFRRADDAEPTSWSDDALADALRVLHGGGIVAIKGVGGYHLACDAYRPAAVDELRRRKRRGDKPFAVLVADVDQARALASLDEGARAALASPQGPIVLAPAAPAGEAEAQLVAAVAPGVGDVGLLLPYSPLHHLLVREHPSLPGVPALRAVVLTSGNLSDEPLCTSSDEADQRLAGLADAFLHHDRPIHVACDDSVVRVVGGALQPVRRSRGFAPMPVRLPLEVPASLAVGGELKTTACLARGRRAWLSQHIGDTENLETLAMLHRTTRTLAELVAVEAEQVVADLHPAYLSRRWAADRAELLGVPLVLVQHHHAHLAALLAEHGVEPGEPVLGLVLDGTGYGLDGTIWGGELLLGSYGSVERVGHLRPVPLPGGDAAVKRPARTALAHLHAAGVAWDEGIPVVGASAGPESTAVGSMLRSGFGCTPTTSAGRLFDALASLLGVRHDAEYEGQAAMELEALAASYAGPAPEGWQLDVRAADDGLEIDPAPVVAVAARWVRDGGDPAAAGAAFHAALADALVAAAERVREERGVDVVGLSGGVFQNALLTRLCADTLGARGFRVLLHRTVPPNDGGIALGQIAVAGSGGGTR
jgi:hydrogenase maturation protein HypF